MPMNAASAEALPPIMVDAAASAAIHSASHSQQHSPSPELQQPIQRKVILGGSNVFAYMVQGTGVFMCLDIVAWPMEVARTRMQATKDNKPVSTFKLLRDIARTEVLTSLPSQAVYLGVYEHATTLIERHFPDRHQSNSATREIAVAGTAGFLAETFAACLYVPTDVISQRLRVQADLKGSKHLTSVDILKSIYRTNGFRGLYQGFGANIIAFAPWSVTHWAGYEATKKVVYNMLWAKEQQELQEAAIRQRKNQKNQGPAQPPPSPSSPSPHQQHQQQPVDNNDTVELGFYAKHRLSQNANVIIGLAALNAAFTSLIVSSPFDMIRVRLQLLDSAHAHQAEQLQRGWWAMARQIAREEGWRGFAKGLKPKLYASIPGCVGYLFAYEYIKDNLESDSSSSSSNVASSESLSSC
ncbi:hypothetical protein DFQ27_000479 [Actinomortierella ambigua]|uniref:Mitochondrial carrier protein n=1 Tax=Actinomortierella ambigua TaxID=1343610 RepID=A0A9P6QFX3_9FUNG|nr:hypothetical protein DFQ27_000479 [Actinomortierella ambigua]